MQEIINSIVFNSQIPSSSTSVEASSRTHQALFTEEEYTVSRFHPRPAEEYTVSTFHPHPAPPTEMRTPGNTSYYRAGPIKVLRQNTYGQYLVDLQREKMDKNKRKDEDLLWDCLKRAILERRRTLQLDDSDNEWD